MRVALGTFACAGLGARFGNDLEAGVGAALTHYTGRLRSGRPPIALPPPGLEGAPRDPVTVLDLTLGEEVEALLAEGAERQGVNVERLVVHAVMVYLAELDFLAAPPPPPQTGAGCRGDGGGGR